MPTSEKSLPSTARALDDIAARSSLLRSTENCCPLMLIALMPVSRSMRASGL